MGYNLISVKCPDCGQILSIEDNRTQAFCAYCGAKILISNENEYIYRQIDEANVKKAENEKIIRLRELDLEEKKNTLKKTLTIIWATLSTILIVIAVVLTLLPGNEDTPGWANGIGFLFYVCAPIIGGGAYLIFKLIPDKENEKTIKKQGGIRIPKNLEPFDEKKYFVIESALRATGFTNITCISLHDLGILSSLRNSDKIEKITVDGKEITSGGKMYMPNVRIIITYHSR